MPAPGMVSMLPAKSAMAKKGGVITLKHVRKAEAGQGPPSRRRVSRGEGSVGQSAFSRKSYTCEILCKQVPWWTRQLSSQHTRTRRKALTPCPPRPRPRSPRPRPSSRRRSRPSSRRRSRRRPRSSRPRRPRGPGPNGLTHGPVREEPFDAEAATWIKGASVVVPQPVLNVRPFVRASVLGDHRVDHEFLRDGARELLADGGEHGANAFGRVAVAA